MADPKKINQLDNELAPSGDNYMSSTRPGSGVSYKWRFSQHFAWMLAQLKASILENDSNVAGATIADALNAIDTLITAVTSDSVGNDSSVTGATVTAALNTLKGLVDTNTFNISQVSLDVDALEILVNSLFNYPLWIVLANTEYTATPASVNTITTSSDTSTKFNIGDVLRIELTGALIRYVKVQDITPTLITVFGDLLTADIVSIRYEWGNNAAIQHYECWVGSDEIYQFSDTRPTIRKTNGGTASAPTNTNYGSDIFYEKQLRVDKGTLVYARYTAHELDSSVTAATLEMKFGANTVVNWSIDALAGDSGAIVADYASTEDIYPVVNVTNPSGDKKVNHIKLFFEMFNDKDPV